MFQKDAQQIYRVVEWERHAWLLHGFGTRASENWPPRPSVSLKQIHSNLCVCADEGASGPAPQPGDALISNTPGRCLSIRTADCIPILMVDERCRAIAAVHAGWRGSDERIAVRALESLTARYGTRAEEVEVAIGPGICAACYTVGPEVAARFQSWFPEWGVAGLPSTLDLAEASRRQLIAAGVAAGRIYTGAPCTSCHPDEFPSYRRDGAHAGRVFSIVGIRA